MWKLLVNLESFGVEIDGKLEIQIKLISNEIAF